MKTDTDLIKIIDRRVEQRRTRQALKVAIDSAYTTGQPKTKRPEDSAATGKTKQVLLCHCLAPPTAGGTAIEQPVGDDSVVLGQIGTPPDLSNGYLLLPEIPVGATTTTVGVASNNQVRCYRFVPKFPLKISKLIFEIVVSVGGQNVGMAVYDSAATTRHFTTGSLLNAGGHTSTSVGPFQFQTGVPYWIAWSADDNTITWRAVAMDSNFNTLLNNQVTHIGTAANPATNGAPPATLGTISSGSFAVPVFKLQA